MDLCSKYKPLHISELEFEYPKLVEYLNSNNTFIINGPKHSGKSTIVKLYLQYLDYDYLLFDDFSLTKEYLIEKVKYRTNSVFSYFYNKKFIIVIDNFELFDTSVKDFIVNNLNKCQFLIITNKYLNSKINYVRINSYSIDYILNLYCTIFFLEKGYNCSTLPEIKNISEMYSILEFTINSEIKNDEKYTLEPINNYYMFFDKFDYKFKDLVFEKNFGKKLYILDKINSYSIFQNNLIYNYKSIDELSECYDNLCNSILFMNNENMEYYSILSIIGTSYKLDEFKIHKENFQFRKKKNLKYY